MDQPPSSQLPFGLPLPPEPLRRGLDARLSQDKEAPHTIEVGIPMRDGVELVADVHLPAADALPAPAIVVGTPYDKSWPFADIRYLRDAGYVAITYDVRGRGKSEGEWDHFTHRDGVDGHDVVEWAAAQEWCTGDVGMIGISYMGFVIWATLANRPPHLRAAVSVAATGKWMDAVPYTHGCFQLFFVNWFYFVRRRINQKDIDLDKLVEMLPIEAMGDVIKAAGPAWEEWLAHDTLDDYWKQWRRDGEFDHDIPCLHVTGWHDREDICGAFHYYEQMMADSPARDRQWLLAGPWCHGSCMWPDDQYKGVEYPGAAVDMEAIASRFFDHHLRGERNGVDEEPRVRLYDSGAKRWEVRSRWGEGTEERSFFLGGDGSLEDEAGADGEDTYRYDPLDAPGVRFSYNESAEPPLDLGELENHPGTLTWSTPPLEEDLTVRGWGELELWAATDGDDTDWHAKVADVDPDGRSLQVAGGCLRASYGDDPSAPAAIQPGELKRYTIELTPAFHTFRKGHRLRVILASSDYPWFARSLNRFGPIAKQSEPRVATNTVQRGAAHPSSLKLNVEDRRGRERTEKALSG